MRRSWTQENLKKANELILTNSATQVAQILGTTKNSVLGALYREKIKNGYVPPLNSPYARIRKYRKGFG